MARSARTEYVWKIGISDIELDAGRGVLCRDTFVTRIGGVCVSVRHHALRCFRRGRLRGSSVATGSGEPGGGNRELGAAEPRARATLHPAFQPLTSPAHSSEAWGR